MSADSEFYGKPFYPAAFFWRSLCDEPEKVASACRVLNSLTEEQRKAVDYLVNDRVRQYEFDLND